MVDNLSMTLGHDSCARGDCSGKTGDAPPLASGRLVFVFSFFFSSPPHIDKTHSIGKSSPNIRWDSSWFMIQHGASASWGWQSC